MNGTKGVAVSFEAVRVAVTLLWSGQSRFSFEFALFNPRTPMVRGEKTYAGSVPESEEAAIPRFYRGSMQAGKRMPAARIHESLNLAHSPREISREEGVRSAISTLEIGCVLLPLVLLSTVPAVMQGQDYFKQRYNPNNRIHWPRRGREHS